INGLQSSFMFRLTARVVLVCFSLFSTARITAQEPAAPPAFATAPTLTLEECIARAMEKNFELRVESFSTEIARESLNVANAAFEPTFTASLQRFHSETAPAAGGRRSDTTDARLGVE